MAVGAQRLPAWQSPRMPHCAAARRVHPRWTFSTSVACYRAARRLLGRHSAGFGRIISGFSGHPALQTLYVSTNFALVCCAWRICSAGRALLCSACLACFALLGSACFALLSLTLVFINSVHSMLFSNSLDYALKKSQLTTACTFCYRTGSLHWTLV